MTTVEKAHAELVERTCKKGQDIHLEGFDKHLVHMVLGIAGEAGELVDAIKKYTIYSKPLDTANVIEELGDLEWYMQGLRKALGLSRTTVLQYNIDKLNKRYPQKYTDQAAQDRADKVDNK